MLFLYSCVKRLFAAEEQFFDGQRIVSLCDKNVLVGSI